MSETSSQLIRLELPCTCDAPCLVREAVDDALDGFGVREQARLIASELVTNAVRHSGAGPDEVIEFQAVVVDGTLVIAVTDPCVAGQAAHIRDEDPGGGGYGLRIVDRLARQWGSSHDGGSASGGSEHLGGQREWAGSEHLGGQREWAGSEHLGGQRVWAELAMSH